MQPGGTPLDDAGRAAGAAGARADGPERDQPGPAGRGAGLLVAWCSARDAASDCWAVGLLIAAGASDWLDGKIARAMNQQSRLGELLDPAADRLYIVSTVIALAVRAIIAWWLVALLAVRELVLGVVLLALRRRGYGPLQVSFVGKAATLSLLYAFPLLFLGSHQTSYAVVARVFGWAFALWGTALYWWAAVLYVEQAAAAGLGLADATTRRHHGGRPALTRRGTGCDSLCLKGALASGEGCSDGGRRGDQAAPDDRQPAEAAAAGGQQADHGARAAAAAQAQLRPRPSSPCSSWPRWCATTSATAKNSA